MAFFQAFNLAIDLSFTIPIAKHAPHTGPNHYPYMAPPKTAPEAFDDSFFVEYGDIALVDVAANDTDVDGAVDPSSLVFFGAGLGTAVEDGGLLNYTANTIPFDIIDSSANDELQYTINDDAGLTSNLANVTAQVIDPLRETDTDSANAALNNQTITLDLSTEDRTFNTSSFVEVDITSGSPDPTDINVSLVIDESGSISSSQFLQEQQAVQNTIDSLRGEFGGTGTNVEVQIVEFASDASSAAFDLFDSALDDVTSGTPIATQSSGFTNYEAALQQAVNFFTGQGGDENFLLFTSDGQPNSAAFTDEVDSLTGLNVSRTAVGFGSADLLTLNQIDNSGGAQLLNSADELGNAFATSPLFPADLLAFSLTVDGNQVADESNLVALGGGDFSLDDTLMGLLNSLGSTNTIEATASFDVNSDGVADEFRTATTIINGTDGSDIVFA